MKIHLLLLSLAAFTAVAAPSAPAIEREGVLGDAHGMTLYIYKNDEAQRSHCNADCAKAWPPLIAPARAHAEGAFGVIRRDDGRSQWTWRGQPLYRHAGDAAPGEARGERLGPAWIVVRPQAVRTMPLLSASDYAF